MRKSKVQRDLSWEAFSQARFLSNFPALLPLLQLSLSHSFSCFLYSLSQTNVPCFIPPTSKDKNISNYGYIGTFILQIY